MDLSPIYSNKQPEIKSVFILLYKIILVQVSSMGLKERSHITEFSPIFPLSNFSPLFNPQLVMDPFAPKFYSLIKTIMDQSY